MLGIILAVIAIIFVIIACAILGQVTIFRISQMLL
jgi:hypothetical protein